MKALILGTSPQQLLLDFQKLLKQNFVFSNVLPTNYTDFNVVLCAGKSFANMLGDNLEFLTVKKGTVFKKLYIVDIHYFQAEQKYVIISHPEGEFLIQSSLSKLSLQYQQYFIRIHRKYLVAKREIIEVDLKDNYKLRLFSIKQSFPISRRRLAAVKKFFSI